MPGSLKATPCIPSCTQYYLAREPRLGRGRQRAGVCPKRLPLSTSMRYSEKHTGQSMTPELRCLAPRSSARPAGSGRSGMVISLASTSALSVVREPLFLDRQGCLPGGVFLPAANVLCSANTVHSTYYFLVPFAVRSPTRVRVLSHWKDGKIDGIRSAPRCSHPPAAEGGEPGTGIPPSRFDWPAVAGPKVRLPLLGTPGQRDDSSSQAFPVSGFLVCSSLCHSWFWAMETGTFQDHSQECSVFCTEIPTSAFCMYGPSRSRLCLKIGAERRCMPDVERCRTSTLRSQARGRKLVLHWQHTRSMHVPGCQRVRRWPTRAAARIVF